MRVGHALNHRRAVGLQQFVFRPPFVARDSQRVDDGMIQGRLEGRDLRSTAIGQRHSPQLYLPCMLTHTIGGAYGAGDDLAARIVRPGLPATRPSNQD